MDAQQAEAAAALMAPCSEEDGAVRCPLWRQVREEARSMVSLLICVIPTYDTSYTEVM